GFYWTGSEWVRDDSLVAGLGDVGDYSVPAIAFNLTWKGKWNLVSGFVSDFHEWYWGASGTRGYHWNGTQWVSDSSLDTLLLSQWNGPWDYRFQRAPAIAFNITGDGGWNMICGDHYYDCDRHNHIGTFNGYVLMLQGSVKSVMIPLSNFKNRGIFYANDTVWRGTDITYTILDWDNNTIMNVVPGQDISDLSNLSKLSIRLFAELTTTNPSYTPVLYDWEVCWATGEVDLMPTAIDVPGELYANVTWRINATVKNDGDAHSGGFNAVLYANNTEAVRKFVEDIAPGESNVTFEWTPAEVGNYTLKIIVDTGDIIPEINETNNELTIEVAVLPTNVRRLTFDSNSSISPSVATDSEGNIHVVWSENRGGWQIYYKKLAPNGTVLVDERSLCSGTNPKIAVDSSGNVHMVFNNITNSINVSYMKLDNSGNILIEPKQVMSGTRYRPGCGSEWNGWLSAKPAGIAVDHNGNVHVVACGNCGKMVDCREGEIKYVKLDNNGNELVNYTIDHVSSHGHATHSWSCLDAPSGIAVDSEGNAYTAYSKGPCDCSGYCSGFNCHWPSCVKAYYVKIDSEGVHTQDLTGELPLPSLYPSVCVDSGDNKYVIWSQHNSTATMVDVCPPYGCYIRKLHGFDFYLTKFDKSDNKVIDSKRITFEDYPVVSGQYYYYGDYGGAEYMVKGVRKPVIDTESGVIHVPWEDESGSIVEWFGQNSYRRDELETYYMAFDTNGSTITEKTLISFDDGDSWEPDIDGVQNGAHLVWTDNRDGNNEIYYARLTLPENRVFMIPPPDQWTPVNENATYTFLILSTVPGTDTFNLSLENLDGADVAELSNATVTLGQYDTGEVILNVTDAVPGDYRVNVRAESQTNPEINASATITTSVVVPKPDLIATVMDAYHNNTRYSPYFNLSNVVDVEVENMGTADASTFNVCLYADAELVGKQTVSGLALGKSTTVQFKWTPAEGTDCEDGGTPVTYTLRAIADCDGAIAESDETNNESAIEETVYWAGYSADEKLNLALNGTIRGG
ncbi:MAG: hypothetical protein DRJ64_08155, partial [Thermoprotei archaeon]